MSIAVLHVCAHIYHLKGVHIIGIVTWHQLSALASRSAIVQFCVYR